MAIPLPTPIESYFAAKQSDDTEGTLALFTSDATVWDHGEDLELKGIGAIREWLTGTISEYKLTTEIRSLESVEGEFVVRAAVSGNFPSSPYEFVYRFKLSGDKIVELAIDPIGPLAG